MKKKQGLVGQALLLECCHFIRMKKPQLLVIYNILNMQIYILTKKQ